jgi:predicted TIM-barrel fold metal-dependent hydrolase
VHVLSPYSGFYNYGLDTAVAIATSKDSNNEIAQMTKTWPDRFAGLATLPMQDVKAAIAELERVMVQLGFKGAMINDHVNGRTLDEPEFLPFWKAAEQLGHSSCSTRAVRPSSVDASNGITCRIPSATWRIGR